MGTTNVDDIYELSPLQRGMLLHTVHDGSADMYLGQHVYLLDGPLDTDTLVRAWRAVFAAHPALRTSFHWDGLDTPVQVVHRDVAPPAHVVDWSALASDEQDRALDTMLTEDRATGFDLTVAPLQRLHVVRLGEDRHALAWTHHHLLLDGWSVPLFMNEVMAQYQVLLVGGPTPTPAPPFRDYIAWLERQDVDAAERFWAETLGSVTPRPLPGLAPLDPRRATGEPRRDVVDIAGALEDGLREAAARHHVTVGTLLHAAWATVLSRLTGSDDVVFGCVSSGRPADLPGSDRMIGMFVNTLPVALTVPADRDLGEWLREVQRRQAAVRQFEYSPLADVKRWAGRPGRTLFDSLVVLGNYDSAVGGDSPLADVLSVRSQTTFDKVSVPLAVIVNPAPVSELQLLWHEERFDAAAVQNVLDRLLAVLEVVGGSHRTADLLAAAGPVTPSSAGPDTPAPADTVTTAPEPPATDDEERVAAVWRDVLELDTIDVTANFFDLGGDSFAAVRAVSRLDGATVALLALNPTVRDFALALADVVPDDEDDDLDAEIAELERRLAETSVGSDRVPAPADDLQRVLTLYYEGPGAAEAGPDPSGRGELEFLRTQEILLRHLPPAPAVVADIGGGLGRFSLWLAGLGYRVVHRDLVGSFVAAVATAATAAGLSVDTAVGDARGLDLGDDSVDAVLVLGPLQYLPDARDRAAVLREAHRVVRPGGTVCVAAMSRWATRLDGVLRDRIDTHGPQVLELLATVEATGTLPALGLGGYTAYTHLPADLRAELDTAGFTVADLVCVEGAAALVPDLTERMADPLARAAVLDGARAHERVPDLLGLGPHLLATGIKP